MHVTDVPEIAVQQILRCARGRIIPGNNKYARVCRQWRHAEDEPEPLQLFMNLSHLSEEDLARASSWLAMHGQCVDVLVIEKDHASNRPFQLSWFGSTAPALKQLRRLEVVEEHSLARLVPVLQQLPQLQHLAANVSMVCTCKSCGFSTSTRPCRRLMKPSAAGVERWCGVPDVQELCPQLSSLHLTVHTSYKGVGMVGLSELLSPGLQRLSLAQQHGQLRGLRLFPEDLTHLTALQQLMLNGVVVDTRYTEQLAQVVSRLQQVQVHHPDIRFGHMYDVIGLAPSLTELEVEVAYEDLSQLTSCAHLTRLVLVGTLQDGTADALAALTGLRELGLRGVVEDSTVEVVQQVAGMAQLRSLQLEGWGRCCGAYMPLLVQCTQLTSLVLLAQGPGGAGGYFALGPSLQQLTGLQSLTVREAVVMEDQGAWLAPLTQLTRMCVTLHTLDEDSSPPCSPSSEQEQQRVLEHHSRACALWQQQARQWPSSLQQVVFWVTHFPVSGRFKPMCWQLPASAPGRAQVTAWLAQQGRSASGWARPLRPCPHLPGVWELQSVAPDRPWHLMLMGG